uniref:Uncharacterized protein n=1 Tax=Arundo donax TaxID=35708 RepID=A0A0A9F2R4_ARUDO
MWIWMGTRQRQRAKSGSCQRRQGGQGRSPAEQLWSGAGFLGGLPTLGAQTPQRRQ